MAFVGHKSAQTPHFVHSVILINWGLRLFPISRIPFGQTPIQIRSEQGLHFLKSIVIGAFDFCIWIYRQSELKIMYDQ